MRYWQQGAGFDNASVDDHIIRDTVENAAKCHPQKSHKPHPAAGLVSMTRSDLGGDI
jgi:hypothetical protein